MTIIDYMQKDFDQAISKVLQGIREYENVMKKIATMELSEDVNRLSTRGLITAARALHRWSAVGNDLHVMNNSLKDER